MPTYLVVGVSGHTGSVVAQQLLEQKQKVRVLVRDAAKGERWKKRGAEVAVGSVDDAHAMGAALRGADAAYLLIPPPPLSSSGVFDRARRILDTYVQTVSGSHLKCGVLLSSIGAHQPEGTGMVRLLHTAEKALSTLKVPFTFLRAPSFVENWASSLDAARDGQLPTFYPADFKYPQAGTHDIGLVASALITEHPKAHRTVELAGPSEASPADVAQALSKLFGSEVKVAPLPVGQTATTLQGFGISAELAGLFQETYEAVLAGKTTFEHPETVRRGKESLEVTLGSLLKKG
jgi:uncharacterized protein YbjT (DUF2867 family)